MRVLQSGVSVAVHLFRRSNQRACLSVKRATLHRRKSGQCRQLVSKGQSYRKLLMQGLGNLPIKHAAREPHRSLNIPPRGESSPANEPNERMESSCTQYTTHMHILYSTNTPTHDRIYDSTVIKNQHQNVCLKLLQQSLDKNVFFLCACTCMRVCSVYVHIAVKIKYKGWLAYLRLRKAEAFLESAAVNTCFRRVLVQNDA